jgi:hypothetical protein
MTDYYLQGIASVFGECISDGNKILFLKTGVFDEAMETEAVSLFLDHDKKKCLATTDNRLEVYAGAKSLAFRYAIPDSWGVDISDQAELLPVAPNDKGSH